MPGSDRFVVAANAYGGVGSESAQGIWIEDQNHQLQSVIHTGSRIQVGNESKEVRWVFLNQPSAADKIPFNVVFRDDTEAILMWDGAISSVALPGDYNADGIVDTADFVVWRKGMGATYSSTDYTLWRSNFGASTSAAIGDFNHDGTVSAADYVVWRKSSPSGYTLADYDAWRAHFGQSAGGASVTAAPVPEPSAEILMVGTVFFLTLPRRRLSL